MKRGTFGVLFLVVIAALPAQTLFQSAIVRDYQEGLLLQRSRESLGVVTLERALAVEDQSHSREIGPTAAVEVHVLPIVAYTSWNSHLPFGDRDGSLWQGRGANAALAPGLFTRGDWWSLTVAPEFSVAENREYPLGPSGFSDNPYGHVSTSIDLPQRMGDDAWTFAGWGQSEARLYWNDLTLGVGTQNIKLGPATVNPLFFSGNAAGFPHVDLGVLPLNTQVGTVEARAFWGRLTESEAYDEDPANDYTYLSVLSVYYRPQWFPMLTVGANRTVAVNAQDATSRFLWQVFDPRPRGGDRDTGDPFYGTDAVDQMVSLTAEIALPGSGFRGYLEWAREDFASNLFSLIQIPYHSAAWTAGAEQRFVETHYGELVGLIEFTRTLQSRNYSLDGQYSPSFFYNHGSVRHGHTHQGQLLGAPAGPGTEGGTLRFRWQAAQYRAEFFFDRFAVNADYVYANSGTLDRSHLDTEMATGLAWEQEFDSLRLRLEGAFVNRRGFNYDSSAIRNNVWLAATVSYGP